MTNPTHPAYEALSARRLDEYRADGFWFRHKTTGCEVYHLRSDDEENTFAFCFATPSRDSTGVAHIVEHSVLCGSRRYPVKDAFLALARGSLQSFLNALTYPDKTVYPAASTVEADYWHLLDVYGDAVFFPILSEDTFLQEAHHLEYGDDGRLFVKGVVYNEMRGAYENMESFVGTLAQSTLFSPGHPYSFDSGGDPDAIPSLDYATFRDFHATRYHPSNCRIFLHGNIDTARQLRFLHENFLAKFGDGTHGSAASPRTAPRHVVTLQPRFASPIRVERAFAASDGSDAKTSALLSWLIGPYHENPVAIEAASDVLLGHDGSPLAKALRDSGLGEDLSPHSGLDINLNEAIFTAGLRGVGRGREAELERLCADTIGRVVREGIPQDDLDAALHGILFSNREVRRGYATYGLRLFDRSIRGWLNGAGPEGTLSFERYYAAFRADLDGDPRHLERLMETWFLDNAHRVTLTVFPEPGLFAEKAARERERLDALDAKLDPAGRDDLRRRAKTLAELQNRPETPEEAARIPALARADIPTRIDLVPRRNLVHDGVGCTLHPLFTNGVRYVDFAFRLDDGDEAALLLLPLLSRFASACGTSATPYDRMARRLSLATGGFGIFLQSATPIGADPDSSGTWLFWRLKALDDKLDDALDAVLELMTDVDFRDERRASDLADECRNDASGSIIPAGTAYALSRAGAGFSRAARVEELFGGLSQYAFLRDSGERLAATVAAARGLLSSIVSRGRLRVNLTADPDGIDRSFDKVRRAIDRVPTGPSAASAGIPPVPAAPAPAPREAWAIPASVGYAALCLPGSDYTTPEYVHEGVLAHALSTGYLWNEIRVKGGAYGASAHADGMERCFAFSTYRDPAPTASLGIFRRALETLAEGRMDRDGLERAVVGAAGRDLKPLSPEERGYGDFRRELYGLDDGLRAERRNTLLATGPDELRDAAGRLAGTWERRAVALISGADEIELMTRLEPDTVVRQLPL